MASNTTLEEHRTFRHKQLGVQLYFTALWARKHPEEPIHSILENRTAIYKFSDENPQGNGPSAVFYERPGWQRLMRAAEEAFRKYPDSPSDFENELAGIFGESVDRRIERDYEEYIRFPESFQCGCLRHDHELWRDTGRLCFHIGNPLRPHSIFDDPEYLKNCLLCVALHAELLFHTRLISTGTWLNSNPKFLRYFPQEWKDNMSAPSENIVGHLGYWGQFINARGLFNDRIGEQFRATGKLPFALRESYCTIDALRKHLATL